MTRHLARVAIVALSTIAAFITLALADPAVQHELQHHPSSTGILAALAGTIYALIHAITGTKTAPPA